MKRRLSILAYALVLCIANVALAAGKITKWVDKNGVTHYGDRPPAGTSVKNKKQLNKHGVTVTKSQQIIKKDPAKMQVDLEQTRKDNTLLATYSSAEEIDLAKERNTSIDRNVLKSLVTKYNELKQSLVDTYSDTEKKAIHQKLSRISTAITTKKREINQTSVRYDADKARFLELKAQQAEQLKQHETKAATDTTQQQP